MYTFVFMANRNEALSHDVLRKSAKITKKWMPALGVELREGYTLLPECHSGWFWLAPVGDGNQFLISESMNERSAVIVFGDIFDCGSRSAAQTILEAWESGGSPKIRELEGCFSAVIVNRSDGAVGLIGDVMGRRALSYYTDGRTLIVSPHDVALMSTGRIPVEFDYTSICSVTALEWSLRNRSLLKHVHTCHPSAHIRWSDGQILHIADPILNPDRRILVGDSMAIARNLDQMIENAQANARIFAGNRQEMKCDLSAGLDSRVVWSLLLSVIDKPSRIIATSVGEENCVDIRVAHQLSKMYGTGFSSYVEPPPSPDDFVGRCDLLAFSMNGGTPGKRAMKYPQKFQSFPQAYACGPGGEILRGEYYLRAGRDLPFEKGLGLTPADALQIMRKKSRVDKLPWNSPKLVDAFLDRLHALVNEYAAISANGYDILDMFYLYERMGVWGSAQSRQTWKHPRWSPFFSPQMVKLGYKMPAPIALFATIHHEILRRFTPRAYWVRVNGGLLVLEGGGTIKHLLKKIDKSFQNNLHRLQRVINPGRYNSKGKDMDSLVHDFLANNLMEIVREILMSEGSFALEIFGRHGVVSLLKEHESRTHNHTEVLGLLVSMERWRAMVQGVAQDAARV